MFTCSGLKERGPNLNAPGLGCSGVRSYHIADASIDK